MKKSFLALLSSTLSILTISYASAQTPLYWDPSKTGPTTGGSSGGTGNWDQEDAFWYDGISADDIWNNANNTDAYFTNTAGTVTLTENITAADIYFTNVTGGSYVITNATGAQQLTIGNTVDTGGSDNTIGASINNSSTLNKNGNGRLYLTVGGSVNNTMVNQGELSLETNSGVGLNSSITVASGAALEFNSGPNNVLNSVAGGIFATVTINGTGVTNTGALRNITGTTTDFGQINLGGNNSEIYCDPGTALIYNGSVGPLTDNGSGYNLIVAGTGNLTFNTTASGINLAGSLIVSTNANAFMYLNGVALSDSAYKSSYICPGGTLYVENNNSFGTQPSALMTTNCIVDGGTINSGGNYSMYANSGITVTTNGATFINNSGTWVMGNIYSPSNTSVTFSGSANMQPANAGTGKVLNLGTGSIIKSGTGDVNTADPTTCVFSNMFLLGGSLTFAYDDTSGEPTSLGSIPTTFYPSNIWLSGGALHAGHSTTINPNRGIYVAAGGGTIADTVSSGGTITIDSAISGPGNMSFPNGESGKVTGIVLAGNNTYTGTTTVGSGNIVTVGTGSSAGTLGTGNTTLTGGLVFNRTGTYTYGGIISGAGNLRQAGSGEIIFTGNNTYSGNTTNSAGLLLVNNAAGSGTGSGFVLVSGGALGGSGTVSGAVTVNTGASLSLGLSTLTMGGGLTLSGNVSVFVNKSLAPSATNGEAVVSGTFTDGTGTITVTNLGPALAAGDRFVLFSEPVSSGGTMAVTGGGVQWNNNLAVDGSISVKSIPVTNPVMNQLRVSNGNLIFSVTNVAAGTYYELSTTNIETPLSAWTPVATNTITGNQFFITNPINSGKSQQYFIMQTQ